MAVTFRPDGRNIRMLVFHPDVAGACQQTARSIVDAARRIARVEAYDSGAYHDSIHVEPEQGIIEASGSRGLPNRAPGIVYAVAGGAVQPRFAPRAGVMRGPDVDYAAPIEAGNGHTAGLHIMRRAAEQVAR